MNLTLFHQTAEYDAKENLRKQYLVHGTATVKYSIPDGVQYIKEVHKMALNVATYVLLKNGEQPFRDYISTSTIDWK